jgi:hypothetical protein
VTCILESPNLRFDDAVLTARILGAIEAVDESDPNQSLPPTIPSE